MAYRYYIVMIEGDAPSYESGIMSKDYYASPHFVKRIKKSAVIEVWDDDRKL